MPSTVKKPQDHRAKDGSEDTLFTYTFPDEQTVTIPKMEYVAFGIIRRARKAPTEQDQMFEVVENVCGEDELAVLDAQPQKAILDFMTSWTEASETNLGESESSSS